jgi:HTH-type transcriptional regulator, glycine betaine synthesis regulator
MSLATRTKPARRPLRRAPAAGPGRLSPVEVEFVDLFVGLARSVKAPKSLGEIYALLYASPEPLTFDHIVRRLSISRGSASQGLRLLRSFGAVKATYVAGDRRDHFVAETELRKLVSGFLRERIAPALEGGAERLARLNVALDALPAAARRAPETEFLRHRAERLHAWQRMARESLPALVKMLDPS